MNEKEYWDRVEKLGKIRKELEDFLRDRRRKMNNKELAEKYLVKTEEESKLLKENIKLKEILKNSWFHITDKQLDDLCVNLAEVSASKDEYGKWWGHDTDIGDLPKILKGKIKYFQRKMKGEKKNESIDISKEIKEGSFIKIKLTEDNFRDFD